MARLVVGEVSVLCAGDMEQEAEADLSGTLVILMDEEGYAVEWSKEPIEIRDDRPVAKVYVTETGTKYHLEGCRYLGDSKTEMSVGDAAAA